MWLIIATSMCAGLVRELVGLEQGVQEGGTRAASGVAAAAVAADLLHDQGGQQLGFLLLAHANPGAADDVLDGLGIDARSGKPRQVGVDAQVVGEQDVGDLVQDDVLAVPGGQPGSVADDVHLGVGDPHGQGRLRGTLVPLTDDQ
jgi:hypothetical protein